MNRYLDITNQKYGRLTALKYLYTNKKRGYAVWLWRCDCGKEIEKTGNEVRRNGTKSCGCLYKEVSKSGVYLSFRGKRHTEKTKQILREARAKQVITDETRSKLSVAMMKRVVTEETKNKMSDSALGKTMSIEARKKMSEAHIGDKSYLWKGGITPEILMIRGSIELRLWREAVFARDNWTCQKCGDRTSGKLNAHHIKNFAQYPELRFAINNGITFCSICHKSFHIKYGIKNNTTDQLKEFCGEVK